MKTIKLISIIIILCSTLQMNAQCILGVDTLSNLSNGDHQNAIDYLYANKFNLTKTKTITNLNLMVYSNDVKIKLAIYTDNNGLGTLIDSVSGTTITDDITSTNFSLPITPKILIPGNYWLVFIADKPLKYPSSQSGIYYKQYSFDTQLTNNITLASNMSYKAPFIWASLIDNSINTRTECAPFTWIDGNTYTTNNNTATHILTNIDGCDSIITLNLTIQGNIDSTIDNRIECAPYTWIDGNVYTANNTTATLALQNSAGCDSLVTLNLTIKEVSDITTTTTGTTITANNTNATYQWINCDDNAIIPNETNATFTATKNGKYAVILTENGCVDTSACVTITGVGISENNWNTTLSIFPNPSSGNFTINVGDINETVTIKIADISGRNISTKEYNTNLINITLNEPNGVYFLNIYTKEKSATIKFIKQ